MAHALLPSCADGPASLPFHPDDPRGLLGDALILGDAGPAPAEAIVLCWLMSLPPELDPARAAGHILALPATRAVGESRLLSLLDEVSRYPAPVLATRMTRRRRDLLDG